MIERVVFDDAAETLRVWFKPKGQYLYHGVPRALFDALAKAGSAGRFFNEQVKGRFRCEPVGRRFRPEV